MSGWPCFGGPDFNAEGCPMPDHVVINPEDREQVRALADAAFPEVQGNTNRLQAALRSLVVEPIQPEPTSDAKVFGQDVRLTNAQAALMAAVEAEKNNGTKYRYRGERERVITNRAAEFLAFLKEQA